MPVAYLQRLEKARARIAATGPPDRRIVVAPVIQVADAAAKDALLRRVVARGGEGLVLRRNEARWRAGTSKDRNVLKVKQWLDAEAVVVGHKNAPSTANLPTVKVQALNAPNADPSTTFDLSVSREEQPHFPHFPLGTTVTFRYRQISDLSGVPQTAGGAPQIVRIHDPLICDCCFCRPDDDS